MKRSDDGFEGGRPHGARARLATVTMLGGLALSGAASCEVLIGIPDVTKDTSSGGGGTGGSPCEVTPCEGDACDPVEVASIAGVLGAGPGDATASGVTARDGVVHWGIDVTPERFLVRTGTDEISVTLALPAAPRRLVDDGTSVFWVSTYQSCVTRRSGETAPEPIGKCSFTTDDRTPGLAVDASRVYWTISKLEKCDDFPDCCGTGDTSCVVAAEKNGDMPQVLVAGRAQVRDLALAGPDVYFSASDAADGGTIERCPAEAAACTPETFFEATGNYRPRGLVAAEGYLYWHNDHGQILRKSLTNPGADPESVATDVYVHYMAADAIHLYFTHSAGRAVRVRHDTPGDLEDLGGTEAHYLALDCANVYWTETAAILRRPR